MFKLSTIFVALAFAASAAHADLKPDTVGLHLASVHTKSGFNNTNPGIYARWSNGITAGVYKNSYGDTSSYIGGTFETTDKTVSVGVTVGLVLGYRVPVMPLLVPSVAFHYEDYAARIAVIPRPPMQNAAGAVHFMIEKRF